MQIIINFILLHGRCFPREWPFRVGILAPFGVIYIFNLIVFFVALCSVNYHRDRFYGKMSKPKRVIKTITVTFLLAVMFVIGWVFGVLGFQSVGLQSDLRRVFQIIFIAVVSFHGLFLFLFQPCRSKDARNLWIKWYYYITCRPHLYHQRGKIQGKSTNRRKNAPPTSSSAQDPTSPRGAAATLAKNDLSSHGDGIMSSIARRLGYRANQPSEVHENGHAHTEDPTILQGTYKKPRPTVSSLPVVEELPMNGSSETLSTSYSSFAPNTTQAILEHSPEDRPELPPRSPSVSASRSRLLPSLTDSDEPPELPPRRSPSLSVSYASSRGFRQYLYPSDSDEPPELPPRRLGSVLHSPSLSDSYISHRNFRSYYREEPPEPPPPRRSGSLFYTSSRGDIPPELPPPRSNSTSVRPSPSHSLQSISSVWLHPATVDGVKPQLPPPRKTDTTQHPSILHNTATGPESPPSRKSTMPTYTKCIPRSRRMGHEVGPEALRKGTRVSVPSVVMEDEDRPELPAPRKRVDAMPNGGDIPKAAPRTGRAARPLPPLPDPYILENQHVEDSM